MNASLNLVARLLLAQLFVIAGIGKLAAYAGTQAYMASAGLPGALLPLVILLEIGGGLALAMGYRTRLVALALAGFSVVSALLFHAALGDPMQLVMFTKNLALAGGLLLLVGTGAVSPSIDAALSAPPARRAA